MKKLDLVQGTTEWHEWRRSRRCASETPVVMGHSPWLEPWQLYEEKMGIASHKQENDAVRYGQEVEFIAREFISESLGEDIKPICVEDDEGVYGASLDGYTKDVIVEIKCPPKGKLSSLWETTREGIIPIYYVEQCQHQLMVSGASVNLFVVFDGESKSFLIEEIYPNRSMWEEIRHAWDDFYTNPPEKRIGRRDKDWAESASLWLEVTRKIKELEAVKDRLSEKLLSLAKGNDYGCGVRVVSQTRRGSLNEKLLIEKFGDLDQFRYPQKEIRFVRADNGKQKS